MPSPGSEGEVKALRRAFLQTETPNADKDGGGIRAGGEPLPSRGCHMKGKSFFDWVIDSMAFVAGTILCSTVFIECLEIIMRYFVEKPQVWTVDVTEYILFLVAFLGAPWLLKKGGHVGVDIVVERLSWRTRTYFNILAAAIGIFVSGVISWIALAETWASYQSGILVIKTLSVQKYYFLFFISLGYFLLLIEFGRQFFQHLVSLRPGRGGN